MLWKLAWYLKRLLPRSGWLLVRNSVKGTFSKKKALDRRSMRKISLEELRGCLRGAGIASGDLIFVHSALSKVGDVQGAAKTVVAALIDAVGESGTVVMPAFTSADDYLLLCERGGVMDLRSSPSGTGKITETFRMWEGSIRSSHPFSSCVARGPLAEYIVRDHARDPRIAHKDSPLARVYELNGKIVALGTDVDTNSIYHCVEEVWDNFPVETHEAPFTGTYIDFQGSEIRREVWRYKLQKHRIDQPHGTWLKEQFRARFERKGIMRRFTFGLAPSWVMDARDVCADMLQLAGVGVTIYSPKSQSVAEKLQR